MLSKSQIDRLGERLRSGNPDNQDLQTLDEYRRSFATDFDRVISILRNRLHLEPTSRHAKTTESIVEKLRRGRLRLSQMQDIAGCRIVVEDIVEQNQLVNQLMDQFQTATKFDRRYKPSHGYRAVHVIVRRGKTPVEVQVRTKLQHAWAEFSEKLADVVDPQIKYGRGSTELTDSLLLASEIGARIEEWELQTDTKKQELQEIQDQMAVGSIRRAEGNPKIRSLRKNLQVLSEAIQNRKPQLLAIFEEVSNRLDERSRRS